MSRSVTEASYCWGESCSAACANSSQRWAISVMRSRSARTDIRWATSKHAWACLRYSAALSWSCAIFVGRKRLNGSVAKLRGIPLALLSQFNDFLCDEFNDRVRSIAQSQLCQGFLKRGAHGVNMSGRKSLPLKQPIDRHGVSPKHAAVLGTILNRGIAVVTLPTAGKGMIQEGISKGTSLRITGGEVGGKAPSIAPGGSRRRW